MSGHALLRWATDCDKNKVNALVASAGTGNELSGIIGALTLQSDNSLVTDVMIMNIHDPPAIDVVPERGPRGILSRDLFERHTLVNH